MRSSGNLCVEEVLKEKLVISLKCDTEMDCGANMPFEPWKRACLLACVLLYAVGATVPAGGEGGPDDALVWGEEIAAPHASHVGFLSSYARSLCSRATHVSRRVLRLCVFFEVLILSRRSHCGRERCGAAQRAEALRAWRTLQHAAAPSTHEHASASQEAQKLLIVDLSFGGLSNRRQSLMLAAAAARLMRCVAWSSLPHAHRARGVVSPV